ncbi:MAG: hypothetical protein Q8P25_04410 [Candidatus Curtissbacteria bacterium]|nr:hypothetical protein [Candidatus Curtissbacteria bacterium]MDZ4209964.1 hypothetical protein [Candidatus Curtissbacteria bacterium]
MAGVSPPEIGSAVRKVALERGGKPSEPGEVRVASRVQKLAEQVRPLVDKPRTVLENFRDTAKTPDKSSDRGIDRMGTRNERGERRTTDEEARLKERANAADKLNREFAQKGYEGLGAEQQRAARERFKQVLARDPEMASLQTANSTRFENLVVEHLKDPKFRARLNQRIADGGQIDISLDDAILEARRNLRGKELDSTRVDRDLRGKRQELDEVKSRQDQFADRTATGGKLGDKLRELQQLETETPNLEANVARKTQQIEELRDEIANMKVFVGRSWGGTTVTAESLAQRSQELRKAEADLNNDKAKMERGGQLERERADLKTSRGSLENEIDDLEVQQNNSLAEKEIANVSLAEAQQKWIGHQKDFTEGLERVIDGAAADFIEDRLMAAEAAVDEAVQKEIAEAATREEKAIISGLDAIYGRGKNFQIDAGWLRRKMEWRVGKLPKDLIQKHMDKLLETEDPAFLLESAMSRAIDPATGRGYLSADEIAEKMADPEFVQQNAGKAVEALIKAKIKTGLRPDEATVLAQSPWGEFVIANQMENNQSQEIQTSIEILKEKVGAIDTKDLLKKVDAKTLLGLLLALFGAVASSTFKGFGSSELSRSAA